MAGINDEKFRKMQDEMSRFEEEIGLPLPDVVPMPPGKPIDGLIPPPVPPSSMLPPPPLPTLPPPPPPGGLLPPLGMRHGHPGPIPPGALVGPPGGLPPVPPMPPGMMPPGPPLMGPPGIPPGAIPSGPPILSGPPGPPMFTPQMMPPAPPLGPPIPPPLTMPPMPPQFSNPFPTNVGPPIRQDKPSGPVVLSSTPMLYNAGPINDASIQSSEAVTPSRVVEPAVVPSTIPEKKKKLEKPVVTVTTEPVVHPPTKKKEKKNRKLMRTAGGHAWEDTTLAEWDDDDFRLFCGDLGNDVTDEVLSRAFSKYASFVKAKVIRDKRTNKTKGFGFVSFKDPQDFIKATKEMNGRYVGSRPIKLRKSTWKNRSLDVVRKKEKEKVALINMLTGK